ncbi:MAG TPA: hypothetical protein VLH80_07495 [Nitrospiraceae bacterium]|nr:hypothetical protein [Nitrospiraceae bacterium]
MPFKEMIVNDFGMVEDFAPVHMEAINSGEVVFPVVIKWREPRSTQGKVYLAHVPMQDHFASGMPLEPVREESDARVCKP